MNTLLRDRNTLKRLVESYGKQDVLNFVKHLNESSHVDKDYAERMKLSWNKIFLAPGADNNQFVGFFDTNLEILSEEYYDEIPLKTLAAVKRGSKLYVGIYANEMDEGGKMNYNYDGAPVGLKDLAKFEKMCEVNGISEVEYYGTILSPNFDEQSLCKVKKYDDDDNESYEFYDSENYAEYAFEDWYTPSGIHVVCANDGQMYR